jgi:hypothetical protein
LIAASLIFGLLGFSAALVLDGIDQRPSTALAGTGGGGGGGFNPTPSSISLAPKTATDIVGTQHCVTATVTDGLGSPSSGFVVHFQVSGVNPQDGGSQSTGADGRAIFCYAGQKVGDDTITATGAGLSDTASETWLVPSPVLGTSVTVSLVSGRIKVRAKGAASFHLLSGPESIPVGSSVDATNGHAALTSAKKRGGTQTVVYFDGRFSVDQSKTSTLTELQLQGGDFQSCSGAARGVKAPRVLRRLWGHGKGRTRTSGHNGSGTVRGTFWLTEDRCDGTFFRVTEGVVVVRDFTRHTTVVLRAGEHYLAPAP